MHVGIVLDLAYLQDNQIVEVDYLRKKKMKV
jgi:hypothetical protein